MGTRNWSDYWDGIPSWTPEGRIAVVLEAPDNEFIPRVSDAGVIYGDRQVMHNGIHVSLWKGGYYGSLISEMLIQNRGVHEPQEEKVFQEILKTFKPGSTMVELGSYWAFYSLWFQKEVPDARSFLIEPVPEYLELGMRNFELNSRSGHFTQAYIGAKTGTAEDGIPIVCMDEYAEKVGIEFIDLLHSDIQGYEADMLEGATRLFDEKRIGYVCISTHCNQGHEKCYTFLKKRDFTIIASADPYASYAHDGVLVARAPYYPGIDKVDISHRD